MKISIIIPIYNTEKYIKRCLDSIVNQTYKDLEVVMINDGTPDRCGTICKEYASRDNRMKYLEKKNGGVSSARNVGLENISGEYTLFVDSDDWLELDACEKLIKILDKTKYDVVIFSYFQDYLSHTNKKNVFLDSKNSINFDRIQIQDNLLRKNFGLLDEELASLESADSIVTVWGKIYKTSKLHGLAFVDLKEVGSLEDALFNIDLFVRCESALYIPSHYYHYWKNNTESTTTIYRPNLYKQWCNLFGRMEEKISYYKLSQIYSEALRNRIALSMIGLGLNEVKSNNSYRTKIDNLSLYLNNDIYKNAYAKLKFEHLDLKWRLFFKLVQYNRYHLVYFLLYVISNILKRRR